MTTQNDLAALQAEKAGYDKAVDSGFPLEPAQAARYAELQRLLGVGPVAPPPLPGNPTVIPPVRGNTAGPVAPPATVAPAAPSTTPSAADDEVYVTVNVEAFERGGASWMPPSKPGIYAGVCTGLVRVPDRDLLMFTFENQPGGAEEFRGSLVCGALNEPAEKSGAWKIKDIMAALGGSYNVDGGGVSLRGFKGKACRVEWADVTIRGNTELRIQNVFPASATVGQAL